MSITGEINRIRENITAAYRSLDERGAEIPEALNSQGLQKAVMSLPESLATEQVYSKNRFDPARLTTGKSLNWSTGEITDNSNRSITDYFPVTAGKYLVASYYIRRVMKYYEMIAVCFYDAGKQFISGFGYTSYTMVPEGAVYARVCGNTYMPQPRFRVQIELSDTIDPDFYEPYSEPQTGLTDTILQANRICTRDNVNRGFAVALPESVFMRAGEKLKIYHKNILSHPKYAVIFYTPDKKTASETVEAGVKNYDDYTEISASGNGCMTVPYAVYDDDYQLVYYGGFELHITAQSAPSAAVLLIGDSTVEQNDKLSNALAELYTGTEAVLTLLGTRGASGRNHEGRSGWKAEEYATLSDKSGLSNAFWDGTGFNFSYYMSQQGYASVDAVFIQLGINDIFNLDPLEFDGEAVLGYIDTMVSSVKAYSPDVRIAVNLVIPPNSDGATFADRYGGTQAEWLYRYHTIRYNHLLRDHYRHDSQVTVLGINLSLNTNVDILDGVHPEISGHRIIANTIYDYLANELEG